MPGRERRDGLRLCTQIALRGASNETQSDLPAECGVERPQTACAAPVRAQARESYEAAASSKSEGYG